jgi:hypothetical protein
MRIVDSFGVTNTEHPRFDNGILTFNALLRLAPMLPRNIGKVYTFQMYAEPFLFRIRKAEEKTEPFTITCEALEMVKIVDKTYKCVRFRVELKSAHARTDVWVDNNDLVVKFADTMPDHVGSYALEATLQE